MFMNIIKHTAGIKSKQNQDEQKYVNVGNEFAWVYAFALGKDAAWHERELNRVVNTLRLKRTKWFTIFLCGTLGTPLNMALATLACTLPNIKRIYICDEPWIKTSQQKSSKEANVPIITRNTKSLIPYEVLRILGKGKVLFVSYTDNLKFSLFQEDDLRKLKAYPKIVTQLAKLRKKEPDNGKYQYKTEWISDDEVVIR